MDTNLNVNTQNLINWFNAIRNLKDSERTRALEAFWDTQIEAKCWLVNNLTKHINANSNIYIFGGWIGVLANLIFEGSKVNINKIFSIDIDQWCEKLATTINFEYSKKYQFKSITADMSNFKYYWDFNPDIIINTSTEHVNQTTYDLWFKNIPEKTLVVIQGNNFFDCDEHIRCSNTLNDFKQMNGVKNTLYEGVLSNNQYDRYMCIFEK